MIPSADKDQVKFSVFGKCAYMKLHIAFLQQNNKRKSESYARLLCFYIRSCSRLKVSKVGFFPSWFFKLLVKCNFDGFGKEKVSLHCHNSTSLLLIQLIGCDRILFYNNNIGWFSSFLPFQFPSPGSKI